jgi:aspartyl-tRNA synthetase
VQLVLHPESAPEAHAAAHALRSEDVVSAAGTITRRAPENVNPNLTTGEIELTVSDLEILADADTPPFPIDDDSAVDENLRLRHRSLDLRRAPMQDAIALRHRVTQTIREVLDARDFLEIETPFLTRSTPEGARDFLVPARIVGGRGPGLFYALPQSPQLFKQLLMIGGFERYFQIVRCFRDEDSRADRLPEFTQLDIEMAFVEEEDVLEVSEAVMGTVFERAGFGLPAPPWPRMTHEEAVTNYGSDRPDTRFGLLLKDLGEAVATTEFKVFAGVLAGGGVVRGTNAGARALARSDLDALTELAKQHGAKGLVWAFVEDGDPGWRSPIAKFLSAHEIAAINERLEAPTRSRPPTRRSARCAWSWPAGSISSRPAATTSAGSSASRCSVTGPRTRAGMPSTIRSPRRRRSRVRRPRSPTWMIRGSCCRAPTTSCSTATRSAAGRSVSTAPTCSPRCSS